MKVSKECFCDEEIRLFIEQSGVIDYCDFTKQETKVIDLVDLSETFETFINLYESSDTGSRLYDKIQDRWNVFEKNYGRQVLDAILKEVKSKFSVDTHVNYAQDVKDIIKSWDVIKNSIKTKYRFHAFKDIESVKNFYNVAFEAHSINEEDLTLFRSRIKEDGNNEPYPKDKMNMPPADKSKPGRANVGGIPYLYLSNNKETTYYEARAVYLDMVCTATFRSNKRLKIVAFSKKLSPFSSIYDDSYTGAICEELLDKIAADLSKPMRRIDDTTLEYLPTQYITEYIRIETNADGISFTSSLYDDGINYVVFDNRNFDCDEQVDMHQISKVVIS